MYYLNYRLKNDFIIIQKNYPDALGEPFGIL